MRIVWIIQYLGKSALEAGVIDDAGRGRKIKYRWYKKVNDDNPPPTWLSDLKSSIEKEPPDSPQDPFGALLR